MAEIQRKVIKQSGRNTTSRILQAANDKDKIAAWKLDLDRILQIFNVRSIVPSWSLLTVPLQTELIMNTHIAVSDMRHDVLGIRSDVSGIHNDVSGIRSDVSKIREEIGGQFRSVSPNCMHSIHRRQEDAYNCLGPNQVSSSTTRKFCALHLNLAYLESFRPRGRGPVLDAMG